MLRVKNLSIHIEHQKIVDNVSFQLKAGEISCILGPSGCGKTTVLRTIAGFNQISAGNIILDNQAVNSPDFTLPTENRGIGMVFQDFALFPHLTIVDNIKFGIRKLDKASQDRRCQEMISLTNLDNLAQRYPHELSGGQQQRVAIARALAPKPKLLLLDEPLSNLDVDLRQGLALEIRDILKSENITCLMVTHEQNEAFSIAENIGVMNYGKLIQWDLSYNLYHKPKTSFIADFIGEGVLIKGTVTDNNKVKTSLMTFEGKVPKGCKNGTSVQVLIRPDDIVHDDCSPMKPVIVSKVFRGSYYIYSLKMRDGTKLLSMVHSHHNHKVGERLGIFVELEHLVVFPNTYA